MSEAHRVTSFRQEENKSYPCGEMSLWSKHFRTPTYIKDLDGKVLFEGRGKFQTVLEQAVRQGVELPKADLSNRVFRGLNIPGAKISGASFENSKIIDALETTDDGVKRIGSVFLGSDLRGVSFKKAAIDNLTDFERCNVAGTDFDNHSFTTTIMPLLYTYTRKPTLKPKHSLDKMIAFDKAVNVSEVDIGAWKEEIKKIPRSRSVFYEGVAPKLLPAALNRLFDKRADRK